jgi:ornithine cyclodeaminase
MRVVEASVLRELVREPEALASAEKAFRALAEGRVVQPPPVGLDIEAARGEVHVKGAYLEGAPIFAIKVASGFYKNPERGLPTGSGLVLVFDAATGFPLAVLKDDAYLTDLRTAAAGALATRLLAPPSLEKLAVLGSGVQARFQARAIARVRPLKRVSAWSPHRNHLESYCREMGDELGVAFEPASGPESAVRGADLLVTATPSRNPLVEAEWLEPHATVIAVGSDGPDKQELHADVLARADKVVADRLAQCVRLGEIHHAVEAGLMKPEAVYAELGEIVTGAKAGREGKELIVCDLTGVGAQDAAIAEVAWEKLSQMQPKGEG